MSILKSNIHYRNNNQIKFKALPVWIKPDSVEKQLLGGVL